MAREAFASGTTAMGPDVNDPFEILGVRRDPVRKIAPEDLRAAFRQRARRIRTGWRRRFVPKAQKAFDDALAELSATVATKGSAPRYDWRRAGPPKTPVRLPRRQRQRRASAPPLRSHGGTRRSVHGPLNAPISRHRVWSSLDARWTGLRAPSSPSLRHREGTSWLPRRWAAACDFSTRTRA